MNYIPKKLNITYSQYQTAQFFYLRYKYFNLPLIKQSLNSGECGLSFKNILTPVLSSINFLFCPSFPISFSHSSIGKLHLYSVLHEFCWLLVDNSSLSHSIELCKIQINTCTICYFGFRQCTYDMFSLGFKYIPWSSIWCSVWSFDKPQVNVASIPLLYYGMWYLPRLFVEKILHSL